MICVREGSEDHEMRNAKLRTNGRAAVKNQTTQAGADVLTLAEAAAYLRVTENEIARLVRDEGLPGRKLGKDWRFLKAALRQWLCVPSTRKEGLLMQIGAFEDDPDLGAMLEEIHKQRGRLHSEGL
jgi:excisionase family DNA binding protein